MAVIYAIGDMSGAHINPAVTLAFAARGDFPWRRVVPYWISQLFGALLAALLLLALFGDGASLGATRLDEQVGAWVGFAMECALTFMLVLTILGTAHGARLVGHNAAIAVGGMIALCGLFAGSATGASMNPARSLGPAIIGGYRADLWIYVAGPLVGALLAVAATGFLKGPPSEEERDAARGPEPAA